MKEISAKSERKGWLDILRALAIIMVVYLHSLDNVFVFKLSSLTKVSVGARIFAHCSTVFGDIAVPLFLLITGYLMLDRKYETHEEIVSFWKKRVLPLIIVHVIWTVIYEMENVFVKKVQFDIWIFIKRIFMLHSTSFSHLWYMPMIIGIYFAIPFVSCVVRRVPLKIMVYPIAASFWLFFALPFFKTVAEISGHSLSNKIDTAVLGGMYGLYLVLGYYLKTEIIPFAQEGERKRKMIFITGGGVVLSFAVTAVFHYMIYRFDESYSMKYNFPTLPLIAIGVFLFVALVFENAETNAVIREIAYSSFGIYCSHYVFLKWFALIYGKSISNAVGKVGAVFIIFGASFVIAFAVVEMVAFISPKAGNCLFLFKKPHK